MAKSLLFKVLNDTIGKYIDGLTEENLKLSVFSGTITLENVSLNERSIQELQLPISVVHGFVENINIEIPWMSLESSPVRIFINGVYLLTKPIDVQSFSPSEAREYFSSLKVASLLQEEKRIDLQNQLIISAQESEVTSPGYFENLTQKIMDNLEIQVANVHIRFEDSLSFPSTCFAVGVTLASFVVTTTDSSWNEKFVNEKNPSLSQKLFKLGKFSDLGVYWSTTTSSLVGKTYENWIKIMKKFVYSSTSLHFPEKTNGIDNEASSGESEYFRSTDYLLEPPNILCVKCIHNKGNGGGLAPTFDVKIESIDIALHLDKSQYHQAMQVQAIATENDRYLSMVQHRPDERPMSRSEISPQRNGSNVTRSWWRYALLLVVNKEAFFQSAAEIAHNCCEHRSRYIDLLLQEKKASSLDEGLRNKDKMASAPLSPPQIQELKRIENLLPLCALVTFREIASKKYYDELHMAKWVDKEEKARSSSSWFSSWWGGGEKTAANAKKKSVSAVSENVVVDNDPDWDRKAGGAVHSTYTFDIVLDSHRAKFSLTLDNSLVATMELGCSSILTHRPQQETSFLLRMSHFSVKDEATNEPVMSKLVSMICPISGDRTVDEGGKCPLVLSFSSLPPTKQSTLTASSRPLVFCWNSCCITSLMDIIDVPSHSSSFTKEKVLAEQRRKEVLLAFQVFHQKAVKKRKRLEAMRQSSHQSSQTLPTAVVPARMSSETLEIKIDMAAPVLILPEAACHNFGCLIVDFGHVSVGGRIPTATDGAGNHKSSGSQREFNGDDTFFHTRVNNVSVSYHSSFRMAGHDEFNNRLSQSMGHIGVSYDDDKNVDGGDGTVYLVQPFGIDVDVVIQNERKDTKVMKASSGLDVSISVQPRIRLELNAALLSRILHITEVVNGTFDRTSGGDMTNDKELGSGAVGLASLTQAALSAVADANGLLLLPGDVMSNEESTLYSTDDEQTIFLTARLDIPEIELHLIYCDDTQNGVQVSFSSLRFSCVDRVYDSSISIALGSLMVSDSLRPASQRRLASTYNESGGFGGGAGLNRVDDKESDLASLEVTTIKSARSPRFSGHGSEVGLQFGSLYLTVDSKTVLHLRQFVEVLLGKRFVEYPAVLSNKLSRSVPASSSPRKHNGDKSSIPPTTADLSRSIPAGMNMKLVMEQITLEILLSETSTMTLDETALLESIGKFEVNQLEMGICMEAERTSDYSLYNVVSGQNSVSRGSTNRMNATVAMKSIVVLDTRNISEAFHFKTIVCSAHSDVEASRNEVKDQFRVAYNEECVLTVHPSKEFCGEEENSRTTTDIIVDASDVDVYVSLDAILDLVNVVMDNISAVTELTSDFVEYDDDSSCSSIDKDTISDDEDGGIFHDVGGFVEEKNNEENEAVAKVSDSLQDREGNCILTPVTVKKKNNTIQTFAKISLPSPKLVFLDDASSPHSKAIVYQNRIKIDVNNSKSNVCVVQLQEEMDTHELRHEEVELDASDSTVASLALISAEVFMVDDMALFEPVTILFPTNIAISATVDDRCSPFMDSSDELRLFRDCDGEGTSGEVEKAAPRVTVVMEVSDMSLQVSLNNLLLIHNILLRRTLIVSSGSGDSRDSVAHGDSCDTAENTKSRLELAQCSVSFSLRKFSFILLNDFDVMKVSPVVRIYIRDLTYLATGCAGDESGDGLFGNGSLIVQMDSRNYEVAAWEPIIEPWNPSFSASVKNAAVTMTVNTEHTFLITLTSAFLESFSKTYAILCGYVQDHEVRNHNKPEEVVISHCEKEDVPTKHLALRSSSLNTAKLSFINKLGVAIDVETSKGGKGSYEVETKTTGQVKWHVDATPQPVLLWPDSNYSQMELSAVDFVNVLIQRDMSDTTICSGEGLNHLPTFHSMQQILRVPSSTVSPRPDNEETVASMQGKKNDAQAYSVGEKNQLVKLDEEVFEYQRYVIGLGRKWKAPYIPTDPHNWSDKRGQRKKTKDSIALPANGLWEWQGQWRVDMSGIIGQNIDKEGWEYGFDFSELFARRHSNRRAMRKTDCVRRRRWLRTRATFADLAASPSSSSVTSKSASMKQHNNLPPPMFVCWDVRVESDGSRAVTLRSCAQVVSNLPFRVMGRLTSNDGGTTSLFGPICAGEAFDVPLSGMSASFISFQPCGEIGMEGDDWNWSSGVPFQRQEVDSCHEIDIRCQSKNTSSSSGGARASDVPICLLYRQEGQSRKWTLYSSVQVINALPCTVAVKGLHQLRSGTAPAEVETSRLSSGQHEYLKFVQLPSSSKEKNSTGFGVLFAIKIQSMKWSQPVAFPTRSTPSKKQASTPEKAEEYVLQIPLVRSNASENGTSLLLYARFRQYHHESSTLELFCQNVLVDYSGLNLHLSYRIACDSANAVTRSLCDSKPMNVSNVPEMSRHKDFESRNDRFDQCSQRGIVELSNFHVHSNHSYVVEPANVGDNIYSDTSEYRFVAIPATLQGQQCIHAHSMDRNQVMRGSYWVSFEIPCEAFVCILIDKKMETRLPQWLHRDGFVKTSDKAVGQLRPEVDTRKSHGIAFEIYYNVYCKRYGAGETVNLGSNYTPLAEQYHMYAVFVTPAVEMTDVNKNMWSQVPSTSGALKTSDDDAIGMEWEKEGSGLVMLGGVHKNKVHVGVASAASGMVWAKKPLEIRGMSFAKGPFVVTDPNSHMKYHLACQMNHLPGLFESTKEISIIPHYGIVNTTSQSVTLRQVGGNIVSDSVVEIEAYGSCPWHSSDDRLGTIVQFRVEGGLWSEGLVDVNDIGSTSLLVYRNTAKDGKDVIGNEYVVLNVDVQFAQADDRCAVSVLIWSCDGGQNHSPQSSLNPNIPAAVSTTMSGFSPLMLVNDSTAPIVVQQIPVKDDRCAPLPLSMAAALTCTSEQSRLRGMLFLPPQSSAAYGWLHPEQPDRSLSFSLVTDLAEEVFLESKGSSRKTKGKRPICRRPLKEMKKNRRQRHRRKRRESAERARNNKFLKQCLQISLDASLFNAADPKTLCFVPTPPTVGDESITSSSDVIQINVAVEWGSGGRVIRITDASNIADTSPSGREDENWVKMADKSSPSLFSALSVAVNFFSIGISVVGETPYLNCRRELLSLLMEDVHYEHTQSTSLDAKGSLTTVTSMDLNVMDVQIDNYAEAVVYPVLFRRDLSVPRGDEKDADYRTVPLLRMSCVMESSLSSLGQEGQICFHGAAVSVMPFCVEVDSATIALLWEDFCAKANWLSKDEALCATSPSTWIAEYDRARKWAWLRQSSFLDIGDIKARSLRAKSLYRNLRIHPIKAYLTFVQKDLPMKRLQLKHKDRNGASLLDIVTSLASVELMEIRLNSFHVSNAIETSVSLFDRISAKAMSDMTGQLAKMAGSLTLFGAPANMMRNVGDGVSDFFYEPIAGLKGDTDSAGFVKGLQKGTTSLVGGVVSGTLYSTATLLNSTAGGVSYLSGDSNYMAQRRTKRLKQQAKRGGAISGLKDGGESFVSGVASGVSGVFLKPLTGAKKDGASGFFKGLGQGLVGAVVKPMVGVGDGISNVMHGISNEVASNVSGDGQTEIRNMRPCRNFYYSSLYPSLQVLPQLCLHAVMAQEIVRTITRVKMGGSADSFVCQISLGMDSNDQSYSDLDISGVYEENNEMLSRNYAQSKTRVDHGQLILSENCVFFMKREDYRGRNCSKSSIVDDIIWYCLWDQVDFIEVVKVAPSQSNQTGSQVVKSSTNSIRVHLRNGNGGIKKMKTIQCGSFEVAQAAYDNFKSHEHRIDRRNSVLPSVEDNWIRLSHQEK